jgi:hypothetical protein
MAGRTTGDLAIPGLQKPHQAVNTGLKSPYPRSHAELCIGRAGIWIGLPLGTSPELGAEDVV